MRLISPNYRALLEQLHAEHPQWGYGHEDKHLQKVLELAPASVLDYGCGKGRLVKTLRALGIRADGYDPAVPEWREAPKEPIYSLVTCLDVLEHVEEEFVPDVMAELARLGLRVLADIHLGEAVKHLPDGRNAHITIKPATWWLVQVERLGRTPTIRRQTPIHLEILF